MPPTSPSRKTKAPRPPVLAKTIEARAVAALTPRLSLEQCSLEAVSWEGTRADRLALDGVRLVGGTPAPT